MLVSKSVVNEVVAVKLVNGQEIITKVTAIEGDLYTLSRPYVLMLVRDPETQQPTVTFAPFSMGVDDDRNTAYQVLRQHMVTAPVPARADAAKQYLSVTSGIDLSASGLAGL